MTLAIPTSLADVALEAEVRRLARCEREVTAELIAHLAEFDARRLYLGAGFSSLFAYCTRSLGLSEHETYNRIEAARAARRFPVILHRLAAAEVNLTTVRLLAPHLTPDNHERLLASAAGKSTREVEELVACVAPRPAVPDSVRKVPTPRVPTPTAVPSGPTTNPTPAAIGTASAPAAAEPSPALPLSPSIPSVPLAPRRRVVTPLAPALYEIRFTAGAGTCEKLQLAKHLLRHAVPDGDTAQIIDRALSALLGELARRKFAATNEPRAAGRSAAGSRHVPAEVKRRVWLRDSGRCVFVAASGRRCDERGFLEFHHEVPFAAGGATTVDNVQIRCRSHNAYESDLYFGPIRRARSELPVGAELVAQRVPSSRHRTPL
jgi:hypothetical protein